ncbi:MULTISPECIES: hypothetical protein [unclassified Legionella]|uniref:hypothetical protein n=1 Tax=unclassified Legionella TaxID=2622702 RepID=UPI001A941731|nr:MULTISPECIES: hypothetical protein [unclassified Legionella]MDI9818980.1 hypothetical protein [Legionella sp. PL877]
MPDFFDKVKNAVSIKAPYTSSSGHRNAQRSNAVAEVVGEGVESFNPAALIPSKFAQSLISLHGVFRSDTHASEKGIHCLQFSIAAAHTGLLIASLFLRSGACDDLNKELCMAIFLMNLLYKGTLLVGWIPSEMSKDSQAQAAATDNEKEPPSERGSLSV